MKTKRLLVVLVFVLGMFLSVSTVNLTSAKTITGKKTPPGLVKTPGAMATQNALNHEEGVTGNPHGMPVNYQGTIITFDDSDISLLLKDETVIAISLNDETIIRIPKGQSTVDFELTPGMDVIVHALQIDEDSLVALKIKFIPRTTVAPLETEEPIDEVTPEPSV